MDAICYRRRSRLKRQSTGKRVLLSPRDIELFRLLDRYRYLRSTFICAFFPDADRTGLVKRLGDLFHEGYLDRPEQQYRYANALYAAVYELNDRSRDVLRDWGYTPAEGTRKGASQQFAHALNVADVLASIELGARARPLRFIPASEIIARAPCRTFANPLLVPASAFYEGRGRTEVSIIPDGLFGLEYQSAKGNSYRFFALEIDRGTMPASRARLEGSSYLRKLLAYGDVLAHATYRSHFGVPNLLVLTVTLSEAHQRTIMELLKKVTDQKWPPLFLFKAMPELGDGTKAPSPTPHMLLEPWERQGHPPFYIAEE